MSTPDVAHWSDPMLATLDEIEATHPGARWAVLRRGSRAVIPERTRELVLRRDNRHCRRCSWPEKLRLDHVVPWSHFGPDRSDNLQTLCDRCNGVRSNYLEAGLPRLIGVTAACGPCQPDRERWLPGDVRVAAYCGTCDSTSWVSTWSRIL